MVLHYDQIVPTAPAPGITRRILARGGAMMGVEASFKKDAVGAAHRHPQRAPEDDQSGEDHPDERLPGR